MSTNEQTLTWEEYRSIPQRRARDLIRALAVKHKGRMASMAKSLGVDRKTLIRERADDAWFASMIDKVKREHREKMEAGGYEANRAKKRKAKAKEEETNAP